MSLHEKSAHVNGVADTQLNSDSDILAGIDLIEPATIKTELTDKPESLCAHTSINDVLAAINAIREDASLNPSKRHEKIVSDLAVAIGDLDRVYRARIEQALISADAAFTKTDAKQFLTDCSVAAKVRRKEVRAAERQQRIAEALAEQEARRAEQAEDGKIYIVTNDRQLPDITSDAIVALEALNRKDPDAPQVYVRGGYLARIVSNEDGEHSIDALTDASMRGIAARGARWIKLTVDGTGIEIQENDWPPTAVVSDLLGLGYWPNFPPLTSVVRWPVFAPDGHLHNRRGYDRRTKLFNATQIELGDTEPTAENVAAAKSLLMDNMLRDFPFDSQPSKAHALCLILQPFVRPIIDGPTPIYEIEAPERGTGKGLLAESCAYVSRGGDLGSTTNPERDEELRKRLTAVFASGGSHILIDNVDGKLDHASLASATTQRMWEDRILGLSQMVRIPITQTWILTANNPRMSEDIARRCLRIRLDANTDRPHKRKGFLHPNLIKWVRENRPQLVTAAVTLIRAWVAQGMPRYKEQTKGSYEDWAEVMGGILSTIGVSGFLGNDSELMETATDELSAMIEFVEKWYEVYGVNPVPPGNLFLLVMGNDDLLSGVLSAGNEHARKVQMGKILRRYVDRVIGDYKIVLDLSDKKRPHYQLIRVGDPWTPDNPIGDVE